MTADIVKSIEALLKMRERIGVSPSNKYVFAAPTRGSLKFLRGPDCLNAMVQRCELQNPSAVKSTQLRKYVATVSQIIDLKESELEWLARHMGHDLSVHREYYRLHDSTLELSKVSRLLLAVDEGNATKWQGKKLSEINLDGKFLLVPFLIMKYISPKRSIESPKKNSLFEQPEIRLTQKKTENRLREPDLTLNSHKKITIV